MIVALTPQQETATRAAAEAVNEHKDAIGKPNIGWSRGGQPQDPLWQRWQSFRAEQAVANALGLGDLTWAIYDGGDGKVDLTLPFPTAVGATGQVKYRSERQRDLATDGLDFHAELQAHWYVLVWPAAVGDALDIVGWCSRRDFLHRIMAREPVRMQGKKFEMRWQELRPIATLIDAVAAGRAA
ncbi:MAG: hypothetical protein IT340_20105 [Chloroflexi bacterium]|nr:hypothetical protein [Chloroflexota bacterium]